jgi:hypothetical protein
MIADHHYQSLVLRINPESIRDGKIATFAKPENVIWHYKKEIFIVL